MRVPLGPADFGVVPEACPGTSLSLQARSGLLIASDDFYGSLTAGLSLLVYSLVNANQAGWGSAETLLLIGGAVVLLAAFVLIELRTKAPLVPSALLR